MVANVCGARVRLARERKGMSQVELAAALAVDHKIELSQSDVSEIERGVRGVRDYEFIALAAVLEAEIVWLLTGEPGTP